MTIEKAIDILIHYNDIGYGFVLEGDANDIKQALELAIKELDRIGRGEWIAHGTDARGYSEMFECSRCGAFIYPSGLETELDYKYCPYCKAKMTDGEEA